jgi:hypothetical protein
MNTPLRDEIVKIMSEYATPEIATDQILAKVASKMPEKHIIHQDFNAEKYKGKTVEITHGDRRNFYTDANWAVSKGWNEAIDDIKSILKGETE